MSRRKARRYRQWRACQRKRAYPDLKAALRVARQLRQHGLALRAYACAICKQFHLGHQSRAARVRTVVGLIEHLGGNGRR